VKNRKLKQLNAVLHVLLAPAYLIKFVKLRKHIGSLEKQV
jgi:hypothetical protein